MTTTALCAGPCRPTDRGGPRRAIPGHNICDICEERCWENLHWLADHWADLEQMLTRPEHHGYDGMPRKPDSEETGIELNEAVAELRHQVDAALHHWVKVILDDGPGFTGPRSDPVSMARYLARHHKRITRGAKGADFTVAVAGMRREVNRRAFPSGARLYDPEPPILCVEHGTSDTGERTPCPGHYVTWMTNRTDGTLPDLTCTVDKTHVLTPAGFRRAGRLTMQAGAAGRMVNAIIG